MPSKRPGFNNFSLYDDEEIKALKAVTRSLKAMTPEEGRASLIDAGIITKTGRLTKPYRELYKEDMEAIEAANAREAMKAAGAPGTPEAPPALRASQPAPTRRRTTASHRKPGAPGKKQAAASPRKAAAPRKQGAVSERKSLASRRGSAPARRKHGP
jgi:uncharacterized membrane protein